MFAAKPCPIEDPVSHTDYTATAAILCHSTVYVPVRCHFSLFRLFSRIRSAQGYTEVLSEKVNLGANTPVVPSLFSYFRIVEKKKKEAKESNTHAALPFSNKAI